LRRFALAAAAAAAWLLAAACASSTCPADPAIRLVEDASNPAASYVEVACIRGAARDAARRLTPDSGDWGRILDVRVLNPDGTPQPTAVAGKYAIVDDVLRFTPSFPFDPGRQYQVRYYGPAGPLIERTVSRRVAPPSPPTFVTDVFPSGGVVPENQLRMYLHFSAPMGRRGGVEHVKLLDEHGKEVPDPFLPLGAEFWNTDRTRYTVFFDPGRQKRGILPNRQMGPSLVEGRTYTLVVDRAWIDGNGNPLGETFTRKFRVGPPNLGALDYAKWQVKTPPEGTRAPLVVDFPGPLDHGLLQRAMGVRRDGQPVVGEVRVDAHETRWSMTPSEPWKPGRYELVALSILEDLAGNRIGRAFEIVSFERADKPPEPDMTRIPFSLAGAVDPGARRSTGQ
jgi:hypothetical protein